MSAEWQRIGGIEVREGTDGVVGVSFDGDRVVMVKSTMYLGWSNKTEFETAHCQPRHRLIECADGAVMVLSVDEVDGKPRRGASVLEYDNSWWCDFTMCHSKHEAIAAAVAYVTAR